MHIITAIDITLCFDNYQPMLVTCTNAGLLICRDTAVWCIHWVCGRSNDF